MVGVAVERQGIIRHGAKMITAMASAEVPKFSVVLRKAYAAGFYAMCAPGFEPRATIALPTATIGTMSAEASVNAVYANKIAAIDDPDERAAFVAAREVEQEADFTLLRMGSELVIDTVVAPDALRDELMRRLAAADGWTRAAVGPPPPGQPGMTLAPRSLFFVPGSRPDMIAKVPRWQPDVVVVDLEDAVAASEKQEARRAAIAAIGELDAGPTVVLVRLNSSGSPWHADDVRAVVDSPAQGRGAAQVPVGGGDTRAALPAPG